MDDVLLPRKHHVAHTQKMTSFSTLYIDFVFKTSLGTHISLAKDADGDQKMLHSLDANIRSQRAHVSRLCSGLSRGALIPHCATLSVIHNAKLQTHGRHNHAHTWEEGKHKTYTTSKAAAQTEGPIHVSY